MSDDYVFVNYVDLDSMNKMSTQVRKQAMKRVGETRRRPRRRLRYTVELSLKPSVLSGFDTDGAVGYQSDSLSRLVDKNRIADDKALYDSFIRSLSCKTDPFGTAAVLVDTTACQLIYYFIFRASRHPNTWTYSSSPLLPSTVPKQKESLSHTVVSALHDPLIGNCLLATAASRFYYVDRSSQLCLREREITYTQEALRLCQARLMEASIDDLDSVNALATCAVHLGGSAFYKGDTETAALHIKAAVNLVEHIGGISALKDPYVRGRLISFDDLVSSVQLKPCMLADSYDPGPPGMSLLSERSDLIGDGPVSYQLLLNNTLLPPALQEIVMQVIQCYEARRNGLELGCTTSSQPLADWQWLTMRTSAIRNRLLAFSTSDSRTNVLRVVLLMWTLLPMSDMKEGDIVKIIAPKLRTLLEQISLQAWAGYEDIYLWCLLMGYGCSQEGSDVQCWFAERILKILKNTNTLASGRLGLSKILIAHQKRFLYHQPVQGPITEKLSSVLIRNQE